MQVMSHSVYWDVYYLRYFALHQSAVFQNDIVVFYHVTLWLQIFFAIVAPSGGGATSHFYSFVYRYFIHFYPIVNHLLNVCRLHTCNLQSSKYRSPCLSTRIAPLIWMWRSSALLHLYTWSGKCARFPL